MEKPKIEFSLDEIVYFLSSGQIFNTIGINDLHKIAPLLKVRHLQGGEILMRQGDVSQSLYLVKSGLLKALSFQGNEYQIIGEIGQGEVVGEVGLLTEGFRTATIKAVRDTILFELTKEDFQKIVKECCEIAIEISRFSMKRLTSKKTLSPNNISTIAICPASKNNMLAEFVKKLVLLLADAGSVLHLNSKTFNELYGKASAQEPFNSDRNSQIVSWLQEQETKFRFIVYETESSITQWTLRCLRQADIVLLVGDFNMDSKTNQIEEYLFREKNQTYIKVVLALLHTTTNRPMGTGNWLKQRKIDEHYHLQLNSLADQKKLVRFITGQALGLVLAGGGHRAFGYIGLFRALEELGINFDIVAGNSFGAGIAAFYAYGYDYRMMFEFMEEYIKKYKRFMANYTFPITSIFNGTAAFDILIKYFNEVCIEDLWIPFFCPSSNLTKFDLEIHNEGKLWKALLASAACPGLYPPIINEKGDLLVDGGIINNFPVDLMRKRIGNGRILAVDVEPTVGKKHEPNDFRVSGWKLLVENLFEKDLNHKKIPTILEILATSLELSSIQQINKRIQEADYFLNLDLGDFGMLQIKGVHGIVNRSYDYCLKNLSEIFKK